MELKKEVKKPKLIRYSWLQRIEQTQFAGTMYHICDIIENTLSESDFMSLPKHKLLESNSVLQSMTKLIRGHRLTEKIADLHKLQKRLISSMLHDTSPAYIEFADDREHREAGKIVHEWLRRIGKRHYDMGIDRLAGNIHLSRTEYRKKIEIQEAAREFGMEAKINRLFEINNELIDIHVKRNLSLVDRERQSSMGKQRKVVYADLAMFLNMFNSYYHAAPDPDLYRRLHNQLYKLMNPGRAQYLRIQTMRKKRLLKESVEEQKLKIKEQNNDETINNDEAMKPNDSIFQQNIREAVVNQIVEEQSISEPVAKALKAVPRQYFVDEEHAAESYHDKPLPIKSGQTISQITTVALQTQLLDVKPGDRVLEIGTGSGYQAAVLSRLGCEVYSMERIEALMLLARSNLEKMSPLPNVITVLADGNDGLPQYGPYDGIIVTCGAPEIPKKLMKQLAVGGKMVVPVGTDKQEMIVVQRVDTEEYVTTSHGAYVFVPMLKGTVKR